MLDETKPCNRFCYNEGTPLAFSCQCTGGNTGRCCEKSGGPTRKPTTHTQNPADPKNCEVSEWHQWSVCNAHCGNGGISRRSRTKTVVESGGGRCPYSLDDVKVCNRFCNNGGTPLAYSCKCPGGITGRCCENGGGPITRPTQVLPQTTGDPSGKSLHSVPHISSHCGNVFQLKIR